MRHRKKTVKLKRDSAHRKAMQSNQLCSLIEHRRIKTTLAKAKALRPVAEKMLTLGKKSSNSEDKLKKLHYIRLAVKFIKRKKFVKKLFDEISPAHADRPGGYTRIIKLGPRPSDSAPMAFIEWVDYQYQLDEDFDDEEEEEIKDKKEDKKEAKTK